MGRQLNDSEIIDYDERYETVTAAVSATTDVIAAFRVKPGKKAWLKFLGNNVQAGGADKITFRFLVNNVPYYPFDGSLNQWADPQSNFNLPVTLELPTSCTVGVSATNSDSGVTYTATARIKIVYSDFEKPDIYK